MQPRGTQTIKLEDLTAAKLMRTFHKHEYVFVFAEKWFYLSISSVGNSYFVSKHVMSAAFGAVPCDDDEYVWQTTISGILPTLAFIRENIVKDVLDW